jgi:hypothetical protein
MSVPEILLVEAQLERSANLRKKKRGPKIGDSTNLRYSVTICKELIAKTLADIGMVGQQFSGKMVISFKEGGVSYIEKIEHLK